jgi:inosine/xanthosine triphosphate pyrophosphatase family protein
VWTNGFGYATVFIPKNQGNLFAQMNLTEKMPLAIVPLNLIN